jgi:hypothetical protein
LALFTVLTPQIAKQIRAARAAVVAARIEAPRRTFREFQVVAEVQVAVEAEVAVVAEAAEVVVASLLSVVLREAEVAKPSGIVCSSL